VRGAVWVINVPGDQVLVSADLAGGTYATSMALEPAAAPAAAVQCFTHIICHAQGCLLAAAFTVVLLERHQGPLSLTTSSGCCLADHQRVLPAVGCRSSADGAVSRTGALQAAQGSQSLTMRTADLHRWHFPGVAGITSLLQWP